MKKQKNKSINYIVEDNFEKSLKHIKESKNYIYIVSVIFIIGIILGFVFVSKLSILDQVLKEIILKTSNLNGWELTLFIFNNNVNVSFFALIFGIFLGIIPVIYCLTNGLILGYVFSKLYTLSGITDFWRILPHGVFELPAVIISLALGMKLGFSVFYTKPLIRFRNNLINGFRTFVFVVVPLLVVAAIIEGLLIAYLK